MIILNARDDDFYIEDVITLIFQRDRELFVGEAYTENEYLKIIETIMLLLQEKDEIIPKEDIYNIAKQIMQNLYTLHHEDAYRHYKDIELHKGTSPSNQIERDIKAILNPYEEYLKSLYRDFIYKVDGEEVLINAPKEVKEHFKLLNNLKENIKKDGTIENKYYYKPKKPTKVEFMKFFNEIEEHYEIKLNEDILRTLKQQI